MPELPQQGSVPNTVSVQPTADPSVVGGNIRAAGKVWSGFGKQAAAMMTGLGQELQGIQDKKDWLQATGAYEQLSLEAKNEMLTADPQEWQEIQGRYNQQFRDSLVDLPVSQKVKQQLDFFMQQKLPEQNIRVARDAAVAMTTEAKKDFGNAYDSYRLSGNFEAASQVNDEALASGLWSKTTHKENNRKIRDTQQIMEVENVISDNPIAAQDVLTDEWFQKNFPMMELSKRKQLQRNAKTQANQIRGDYYGERMSEAALGIYPTREELNNDVKRGLLSQEQSNRIYAQSLKDEPEEENPQTYAEMLNKITEYINSGQPDTTLERKSDLQEQILASGLPSSHKKNLAKLLEGKSESGANYNDDQKQWLKEGEKRFTTQFRNGEFGRYKVVAKDGDEIVYDDITGEVLTEFDKALYWKASNQLMDKKLAWKRWVEQNPDASPEQVQRELRNMDQGTLDVRTQKKINVTESVTSTASGYSDDTMRELTGNRAFAPMADMTVPDVTVKAEMTDDEIRAAYEAWAKKNYPAGVDIRKKLRDNEALRRQRNILKLQQ